MDPFMRSKGVRVQSTLMVHKKAPNKCLHIMVPFYVEWAWQYIRSPIINDGSLYIKRTHNMLGLVYTKKTRPYKIAHKKDL